MNRVLAALLLSYVGMTLVSNAQQPSDLFDTTRPPHRGDASGMDRLTPPSRTSSNGPAETGGVRDASVERNIFDQADPTQPPPDMRRILEGEQEQVRRDPPPPIEVVGKVIRAGGMGKALLKINQRYYLVSKNSRFSLPTGADPVVFTVTSIDANGVEIQGGQENQKRLLP